LAAQVALADFGGSVVLHSDLRLLVHAEVAGRPGLLQGTLTAPVVAGVAIFTDLRLDEAGAGYVLSFASQSPAGRLSLQSPEFRVLPPVRRLVEAGQPPARVLAGSPMRPAPSVYLMDEDLAFVALSRRLVSVTLRPAAGGGSGPQLMGQGTVLAVYGVGRFQDLSVVRAGAYVLEYRLGPDGPVLATSSAFDVVPALYAAAAAAPAPA
jgi:hypothetical protein